jgi:Spy/CpxP family protein refolding chaperone
MRLRMKAVIAALIVTVAGAVAAAGVVHAQEGFGPGHGGRGAFGRGHFGFGGGPGLMLRQLNLTDQQKQQVKGIFEQHKPELQQVRERIHTAIQAQRTAAEANPPDDAAIRAKATDVASAEADLAVALAHIRSEVFAILTPEQQQKAQELKQQHEQQRAEMQQRWQQRQQQKQQATPPQQ